MGLKKIAQSILRKPLTWAANRFGSAPDKQKVFEALSAVYKASIADEGKRKGTIISFEPEKQPVIIFSDQHKGARDGSDDFAGAEKNYLAALDYYNSKEFFYVNLGDCEELWENTIFSVIKHNLACFEKERAFIKRNAYCKVLGNHDLFWGNDPFAQQYIKKIYDTEIPIYDGIVLRVQLTSKYVDVFCTHGHQGDAQSDGNAFSKWFVSYVWGPLQSYLEINTNSPSTNNTLKTLHNSMMYEWVYEQPYCLLITGHTHQPVFKSLTHLERLYLNLEEAQQANDTKKIEAIEAEIPRRRREYDFVNHSFKNMNPSYFNSGCCCFDDGTITGIELEDGFIRLIKWSNKSGKPEREVLEESSLYDLLPFME